MLGSEKQARILIVDDEADVRYVLKKGLQAAGFSVLEAATGRDAIALAKAELPDLIVLDVCLPDVGGGEVAYELHEHAATANTPIVFLTALFAKDEEAKYGKLVGGNKTMAKPYEITEMVSEIKASLSEAVPTSM